MQSHKPFLEASIKQIVTILKDVKGFIYVTGIGKSAHIARKCVATWQSVSIPAHFLLAQDLLHGDSGVLRPNDLLIHVSHSGHTAELLTIASHLQTIGIPQMSISNNPNAKLSAYVTHTISISQLPIREADVLNKVPSISCVLFMMVLDMVGLSLAEMRYFTDAQFRRNHPSGNLHNKVNGTLL